jgi:hypothetical protein
MADFNGAWNLMSDLTRFGSKADGIHDDLRCNGQPNTSDVPNLTHAGHTPTKG